MKKTTDVFTLWAIIWRWCALLIAGLFILKQGDNNGLIHLSPYLILVFLIGYAITCTVMEFFWKSNAKAIVISIIDLFLGFILFLISPSNVFSVVFSLSILSGFFHSKVTGYYMTMISIMLYFLGGLILSSVSKPHEQFLNISYFPFSLGIMFLIFIIGNLYAFLFRQEQRTQALISLIQVGQELGVSSSLQKVLTMGMDVIKTLFPCHSCVIYMKSTEEKEDAIVRVKAYSSKEKGIFIDFNPEITPSIVGKTVKEKQDQLINNFSSDPREDVIPKDKGLKSMMISPLHFEEKTIGAILVADTAPDFYTQEDLKLFSMLATQIALAIRNIQIQETMGTMAITDSLSGLFTHGYFQEALSKEITKAKYENKAVSMLILDVDFFKKVNDTYGHPQGDALLKQMGGVFRSLARKEDILCRYGGDEFTVIMTNTNRISAVIIAEKIRTAVEEYEFVLKGQVAHITVSGGVASYPEDAQSKKDLVECADKALYQSKQAGRNKISFGASKK